MPGHDIICIGGSSGGIEALRTILAGLPRDLPAAIFVVIHVLPNAPSNIPEILARAGPFPAVHPRHGQPFEHGHIYVAPPDHHLLLKHGTVVLGHGPMENRTRPAVDPLFRSAARFYGGRVIGVVLSGGLDDGAAGLLAIKEEGGLAVVQDPDDCLFPGMPTSALENTDVDHVVPAAAMADLLARLAREPETPRPTPPTEAMEVETDIAEMGMDPSKFGDPVGEPSKFACPECGGVLFELHEGRMIRFRCRVGHAYSADSLLGDQSQQAEAVLWSSLRALEEIAVLSRQLSERGRRGGNTGMAARFDLRASEAETNAAILRAVLTSRRPLGTGEPVADAEREPSDADREGRPYRDPERPGRR